jgi:predicted transcriptional regulator
MAERAPSGLAELRRSGTVTELLFLYECATTEPTQLRPVAARLGLTVQAASHSFRQLRRRGLIEVRDGRYRPTVAGVAWLHEHLDRVSIDVRERVDRLHVIRSTRALALAALEAGTPVALEIREGLLSARRAASGASRGRVVRAAEAGELVEVGELEGILPITPGPVTVRTLTESDLDDPALADRVGATLPAEGPTLLAAQGLEAYLSLRRATGRPILRFAVGPAAVEAARLGVPAFVLVLDRDLPQLLAALAGPDLPPLDVRPISPARRPRRTPPSRRR